MNVVIVLNRVKIKYPNVAENAYYLQNGMAVFENIHKHISPV